MSLSNEEIQAMMKLIPNNFPIDINDLIEIFDDETRQLARRSVED